jgi:GAF domain-containing protein
MNVFSNLRTRLFTVQGDFDDRLAYNQAAALLTVYWVVFFASAIFLLVQFLLGTADTVGLLSGMGGVVASVAIIVSIQRGAERLGRYIAVGAATVLTGLVIFGTVSTDGTLPGAVLIPMGLSAVLLGRGEGIIVGVTLTLAALLSTVGQVVNGSVGVTVALTHALNVSIAILLATTLQAVFLGRQGLVAEAAQQQADKFRQVIQSKQDIDVGVSQNDVISRMIRNLREGLQLDVVQVYMMDDEQRLSVLLRAGMRRTEVIVLEDDEVLTLGDTHAISDAARFRRPVQVNAASIPKRREYFMPSIQRGLAIPMIDADRVLGVVDIQSVSDEPFAQTEIDTYAVIVGSYSTLIHLLQQLDRQARTLRDQEQDLNRMQTQLAMLQAQRQDMVSGVWGEYIQQRGQQNTFGFDIQADNIVRGEDMPPAMRQALAQNEVYVNIEGDEKILSVPILLRGETLGAMSFALPIDYIITDRQLELARTVALRLGSALENTRLLEQTQQQALRERKATEVASRLYGATDIESLLKIAADSFNDTLGAIQTRIFIEPNTLATPPATPPPNGNPNRPNQNGDGA